MKFNSEIVCELTKKAISTYGLEDEGIPVELITNSVINSVCGMLTSLSVKMDKDELLYAVVSALIALSIENFILQYKINKKE